ncbi:MAG: hypothetical protein JW959_02985 [Pirellulales bacterium]|nr:hypothetical protein [Pirellulales bacterium]
MTFLSGIPIFLGAAGVCFLAFPLAEYYGLVITFNNAWCFFGFIFIVFFLAVWGLYFLAIRLFMLFFMATGMMTREESEFYPLGALKHQTAPWPDCWQKAEKTNSPEL